MKKKNAFYHKLLTFISLGKPVADKLIIFDLYFPENRFWHFNQIVSIEMSDPIFRRKWEKYIGMLSAGSFMQHAKG